jgi:hypothetical protein
MQEEGYDPNRGLGVVYVLIIATGLCAILAVFLAALATLGDDGVQRPSDSALRDVRERLEHVLKAAPFLAPPQARHFTTEVQERCIDPSFDRSPPSAWNQFTIKDYDAEVLIRHFDEMFQADGWSQREMLRDEQGAAVWLRYEKSFGDWRISSSVMIQTRRPMLVSVSGHYFGPGDCDEWSVQD